MQRNLLDTSLISSVIGDYNAIDFLKGIFHAVNGKGVDDTKTGIFTLYTEYQDEGYGERFEGRANTPPNITQLVPICDTWQEVCKTEAKRTQCFDFKEDDEDAYGQQREQIHKKTVDLGQGTGTQDNENPFFGRTYADYDYNFAENVNEPYNVIMWNAYEIEGGELKVPEKGDCFCPRLGIAYVGVQRRGPDVLSWTFDNQIIIKSGYVTPINPPELFITELFGSDAPINMPFSAVYGNGLNPSVDDLTSVFYNKKLCTLTEDVVLQGQFCLKPREFMMMKGKDLINLNVDCFRGLYTVNKIQSYQFNGIANMELEKYPLKGLICRCVIKFVKSEWIDQFGNFSGYLVTLVPEDGCTIRIKNKTEVTSFNSIIFPFVSDDVVIISVSNFNDWNILIAVEVEIDGDECITYNLIQNNLLPLG